MTSARENEVLTSVGPGTPMGELMRRYWLPAALSSEVTKDGAPLRLMLLGEKLLAFRDSNGKVGVMDHRCPHRCASLFYGRNEEGGLRCVYHGWKFDVDGKCIDMPNVPSRQNFQHNVRAKAYRAMEHAGVIWVYMGDQSRVPALPDIEALRLDEADLELSIFQRECNWLQALEGDIDTTHVDFLHAGSVKLEDYAPDDPRRFGAVHRNPEFQVTETDWGTMCGVHRPAEPGQRYWRLSQFLFPCWTMPPPGEFGVYLFARAWVPMDDEHTMCIGFRKKNSQTSPVDASKGIVFGCEELLPTTSDWYGRFRFAPNASNDYKIDRDVQRTQMFTGMFGVTLQDQAITESMGPVVDRTFEHLAATDRMISVTRRRLLQAAESLQKEGIAPPAADNPSVYYGARSGYFVVAEGADWVGTYQQKLASVRAKSVSTAPPK